MRGENRGNVQNSCRAAVLNITDCAVISDPGAGPVAVTMASLPNQKSLRVVSYAAFPSKYMKLAVAATDFYGFTAHFVDQTRCKMEAPVG